MAQKDDVTVVSVVGSRAWVSSEAGWHEVVPLEALTPRRVHVVPSEPNTAWMDKSGDIWVVDSWGVLMFDGDDQRMAPENFAPFTRLVREGSEREAAIREVVQWLEDQELGTYAKWVREHFLSGADQ